MPSIRDLSHITDSKEVKHGTPSSKQCSAYIDTGNPAKTSISARSLVAQGDHGYKRLITP